MKAAFLCSFQELAWQFMYRFGISLTLLWQCLLACVVHWLLALTYPHNLWLPEGVRLEQHPQVQVSVGMSQLVNVDHSRPK